MQFKNLLFWNYWFSQPATATGRVFIVFLIGLLALTFFGLLALIFRSRVKEESMRKLLSRASSCFLTMGLFGLLWLWLRQAEVVFLAWRFWLLAWLVIFVVWSAKILNYVIRRLPQVKAQNYERELKQKYLPGK